MHPQLGNLDEVLTGMQSEGFIRTIETHDPQGEVIHQMVLGMCEDAECFSVRRAQCPIDFQPRLCCLTGQRAAVEIGLDSLVDLVEQVYMTTNAMPDQHRIIRRKQMKIRIQRECLDAESD